MSRVSHDDVDELKNIWWWWWWWWWWSCHCNSNPMNFNLADSYWSSHFVYDLIAAMGLMICSLSWISPIDRVVISGRSTIDSAGRFVLRSTWRYRSVALLMIEPNPCYDRLSMRWSIALAPIEPNSCYDRRCDDREPNSCYYDRCDDWLHWRRSSPIWCAMIANVIMIDRTSADRAPLVLRSIMWWWARFVLLRSMWWSESHLARYSSQNSCLMESDSQSLLTNLGGDLESVLSAWLLDLYKVMQQTAIDMRWSIPIMTIIRI
jgi:hypothetical protein